jgi:hypothetical protein
MRERLYLESIEKVLSGAKIYVMETGQGGVLPFLSLDNSTLPIEPTETVAPVIVPTEPVTTP